LFGLLTEILVGFGGAVLNLGDLNLWMCDFAVSAFTYFGGAWLNLKFSRQICDRSHQILLA